MDRNITYWTGVLTNGMTVSEGGSEWSEVRDSLAELALITNTCDRRKIILPKGCEKYIQGKTDFPVCHQEPG